ncbi:MAG TPA: SpoIID/LytB domain-containing protein [Blastocatellia bacterium]|nr:SpoIID/LytB domain-containing protein [Blastocatellia bacterium]
MFHLIAIALLLCLNPSRVEQEAPVRISLFSLFKPEAVNVRVASGAGAGIEVDGRENIRLEQGETLRVRLAGDHLIVALNDPANRLARSVMARFARVVPSQSATLELILPGKIKRVIRGDVVLSPGIGELSGQLKIVLATDRESAVASIVAAELRGEAAPEAFKTLAVVVRTFMIAHPGRHADAGFDFCDTTHCQLYRGEQDLCMESATPVMATAVASTKGEVLSFAGSAVESYYTASCGGLSATPEMVWGGKSDGYPIRRVACRWCHGHRNFRWKRSADIGSILSALSGYLGGRFTNAASISTKNEPSSQFVRAVVLQDGSSQRVISADTFRRAVGLKLGWNTVLSPSFTIERRGSRFVFRGRGFGSQVGLCLSGAVAQAEAGRSYRDILSFYFPGSELIGGVGRE